MWAIWGKLSNLILTTTEAQAVGSFGNMKQFRENEAYWEGQ